MNIHEKFKSLGITPDGEQWQELDEKFITKYEQFKGLSELNTDGNYDAEIEQLDKELCDLFEELHSIEEMEVLEDDGRDKPNETSEQEEKEETEQDTEKEQESEQEEVEEIQQDAEKKLENEPEKVEPELPDETFKPSTELVEYLSKNTNVFASDLRKFGVPRELWKEKEPGFDLAGFRLERYSPADLMFNRWKVKPKSVL